MSKCDAKYNNECVLLWRIKNYSMCSLPREGCIESPKFYIPFPGSEWQITFYPWNKNNINCIGIGIEKVRVFKKEPVCVDISINLLTAKGKHLLCKEKVDFNNKSIHYICFENVKHEDIIKEDSIFLLGDILTLQCRLSSESAKKRLPLTYSASTELEIEQRVFPILFSPINGYSVGKIFSKNIVCWPTGALPIKMNLSFTTPGTDARTYFTIEDGTQPFYTIKLNSSIACKDGILRNTSKHHELFNRPAQTNYFWNKFSLNQLLKNKKLYLINDDMLALRCELIFSTGVIRSHLEECSYGQSFTNNRDAEFEQGLPHATNSRLNNLADFKEGFLSLREDFKNLLMEKTLCDVVVRAGGREFPVHKAILSARSQVFRSMFESDMKERKSVVVQIDDVESGTMDIFLKYLYVGSVDDLEWDTAVALYSTADKYQVAALKNECSSFISSNLSEENVCDALILADIHQDGTLKQEAQKVFCQHSKSVLLSKEWINLMQKHTNLATEVLQVMATKM